MFGPFDYKIPRTLDEACGLMWELRERAKVVAGGTDLVIGLRNGDLTPECLVDVTRLHELRKIEERDGEILIGAGVTHSELASSAMVRDYAGILSEAASCVGSPQIRNLGTLGGNIANSSPAADTVPPLLVLNAELTLISREGEREVRLSEFLEGPYKNGLKPYEILARIRFRKLARFEKAAFVRLARREAMAVARMSLAVVLRLEERRIRDLRIAAGSVTPKPERISDAETFLEGRVPDGEALRSAARKISETMVRRSGIRPSTSYKKPVVEALFVRVMKKALEGAL